MNTRLVENKGLQNELKNGIEGRPLPLNATTEHTKGERIGWAVNYGFEVLPADVEYYYHLTEAYGIVVNPIFNTNENNNKNLIRRLKFKFGEKYNCYQLLEDIKLVFGDYVKVPKEFRREIQRKRYEMLLIKAQKRGNLQDEIQIMKQLDSLDELTKHTTQDDNTRKPLRGRKRSTNPQVFLNDTD